MSLDSSKLPLTDRLRSLAEQMGTTYTETHWKECRDEILEAVDALEAEKPDHHCNSCTDERCCPCPSCSYPKPCEIKQPKDDLRIVPPGTTLHTCGDNPPHNCEGVLGHATMVELESVHVPAVRAAFSRGRHIGYRDTRDKYEKMLEVMDERVNLWRERAKTALAELKSSEHPEGCECGGFDRNGSHSAGEYVGYCANDTQQSEDTACDWEGCAERGMHLLCEKHIFETAGGTKQAFDLKCADCGEAFPYGLQAVAIDAGFVCRKCWSARNA